MSIPQSNYADSLRDYKSLIRITQNIKMAGVEGIEPPVRVLETRGLPLTDTPIKNVKRQK